MANPAIGTIQCPITDEHCEVARAKSGKFPYYYRGRAVGIIHGKAEGFQRWILSNAKFTEPQQNPYEEHTPKKPVESDEWAGLFGGGG